jgi:hypothetical protein
MEDGTDAAPGLSFASDLDTGFFSAGANAIGVATNGIERVEFGTSEVVFNDGGEDIDFRVEGDTEANLFFVDASADTVEINGDVTITDKIIHAGDTDTAIRFPAADTVSIETDGSERARITSDGKLLVGTSTSTNNIRLEQKIAVVHVGSNTFTGASFTGYAGTDAAAGPILDMCRSRGTTDGSLTKVESNDRLGSLIFRGSDGAKFLDGALIAAFADGATGLDDLPSRLVFSTTADGASSPTERMKIQNDGTLNVYSIYDGTTANAANVHVFASGGLLRSTSSSKYKTNIEDLQNKYADAVINCRPVWYRSTCASDNPSFGWWGFIAEEVAAIDPRLVHWKTVEIAYDEKGSAVEIPCDPEPEGVAYDRFVPHLLNLIKRQGEAIAELQAKVAALEGV